MNFIDSAGNEIKTGDIVRVFHFVNSYKRRKEFMYKQIGQFSPTKTQIYVMHLPVTANESGYYAKPEDFKDSVVVQRLEFEEKNLKRCKRLKD